MAKQRKATAVPTWGLSAALLCWAALISMTPDPAHAAIDSVVTQWLHIAQSSVAALGLDPHYAIRVYAIVASAQYDSILLARSYTGPAGAIPPEAAAVYAAHSALSHLFAWRQTTVYDVELVRYLEQYNVSDAVVSELQRLLVPPVQKLVSDRMRDNVSLFANYKPIGNGSENVGRYQFAPGQTTVRYPQLAAAKGCHLSSAEIDRLIRPLVPFNLSDPEYAQQLEEVRLYGALNSTVRTEYDTNTARFWALGAGTGTIPGAWTNISIAAIPADTPLVHQARFFKILTTTFWDNGIACWRTKYRTAFWRPITAIRTSHGVGTPDRSWTPLLPTPPFPEYPSGHQCNAGVALYLLETFVGVNVSFSFTSPGLGTRRYPSFRDAVAEASRSRMFAGAHFQKANLDGAALGYSVAQYIHRRRFGSSDFSSAV